MMINKKPNESAGCTQFVPDIFIPFYRHSGAKGAKLVSLF